MNLPLWSFAALIFVPTVAAADAVSSLKAKLDEMQSLSGNFKQTMSDNTGVQIQKSSGEFHLKRPGYFLWQSQEPFAQTVLGTPDKLWIYDPDLEQVTVQPRTPEQKNNPASLLAGDLEQLRAAFAVSESGTRDSVTYELKPLDSHSSYKTVEFVFVKGALQELAFLDKLDQTTQIQFDQVKLNPPLAADVFKFTPPPGTDVIVDE